MTDVSLDTLPVEILHRILDSIDVSTIVRSVRCVCRQLYAVVNSYNRFQLDFTRFTNSDLKVICRLIESSKVNSLVLSGSQTSQNDINVCLKNVNIAEFTNLRSLSLFRVRNDHINEILQHVTAQLLASLTIILREPLNNTLISSIFSAIVRTNVQKLYSNNLNYINIEISWPNQNTLQHLTIKRCTYEGYCVILDNSHRLNTLIIDDCVKQNDNAMQMLYTVATSNPAKRQRTDTYSQLISLTIGNCHMSMEDLEQLLQLTPSLIHFKLVSDRPALDQMFVGSDWEQFILNHLRSLNKFQLFLTCDKIVFNGETIFNYLISPFQSQFWLNEKQWLITCDYVPRLSTFRIYTLPACRSVETRWHLFRSSVTDSKCRFILSSNLSNLDVSLCNIRDDVIQCVVEAIRHYENLTELNLSHNKIGDVGAEYLADALRNHETLTTLNLSNNRIGDNGAEYLYNVLKYNKTLKSLSLSNNQITSVARDRLEKEEKRLCFVQIRTSESDEY